MPNNLFRRLSKKLLIFSNIITGLVFLAGCYNEWLFSDTIWAIGLLTLASFYLLVALLLFIIVWLFTKPAGAIISIIFILLAFQPLRQVLPFRLSASFNKVKQPGQLRVMSWNVAQFDILYNKKNPATKASMLDLINNYAPDIACFQEIVAGDTLVNLNTPYYRKFSFYPIFEFAGKLNMEEYAFSYNYKEDFLDHQHFGTAIFSRYPIINKQSMSFYPHDYNSIFQYADIVKGSDTFRVFNIHLQSLKFSPGNLEYIDNPSVESSKDIQKSRNVLSKFKRGFLLRKLQSDRIRAEVEKSPFKVIVCGDFNDVPNSYAYQTIGKGLKNAFAEKGAGIGRTFSNIAPTLRIDNIFADPTLQVIQYTRVAKKLSDHFPIIADLQP